MSESGKKEYRVLARKYRPQSFDDLIGQDALVRTLKNAIESGRIAHAFMLTGIRGVGKTTTARIIAKALNYSGGDGKPTTGPTDDCEICKAISEDRHPDVIEMDAASRTGVDDIREILEGVRYAPVSARYKIYIIDEVHMLSKHAFNALLKTLEEPPQHVKFIFATTEIRKVPVTILSRCQRFDLMRVDIPTLSNYYREICKKEGAEIDDEALTLIARAADGSVRDGLSLLDQAISHCDGKIDSGQIRQMLGISDSALILDILENAIKGRVKESLEIMEKLYRHGADPQILLQDMLGYSHLLTKLRAVPQLGNDKTLTTADELERCKKLSSDISMPSLNRIWQILLNGIGESNAAPNPQHAAEITVIKLSYAADLPDPADLIKKMKTHQDKSRDTQQATTGNNPTAANTTPPTATPSAGTAATSPIGNTKAAQLPASSPVAQVSAPPITDLETMVEVLEDAGEIIMASQIYSYVHLIRIDGNRLEIAIDEQADSNTLTQGLTKKLRDITGSQWFVSLSPSGGDKTLAQKDREKKQQTMSKALKDPIVSEIINLFPGTKLVNVKKDRS